MIKSQAETPRFYIVKTPQGEKRRNIIHLGEAGIPTNTVPKAPDVEKVKRYVISSKEITKSVFQPNEENMFQSVVENVPKANVQSVLRSTVKLVPKANVQSVHSSRVNSTVNSAGKESAHNHSGRSA